MDTEGEALLFFDAHFGDQEECSISTLVDALYHEYTQGHLMYPASYAYEHKRAELKSRSQFWCVVYPIVRFVIAEGKSSESSTCMSIHVGVHTPAQVCMYVC